MEQLEVDVRALEELDANSEWVVQALGRFEQVWDVMTPDSRWRLLKAMATSVIYDGANGTLKTQLAITCARSATSATA